MMTEDGKRRENKKFGFDLFLPMFIGPRFVGGETFIESLDLKFRNYF